MGQARYHILPTIQFGNPVLRRTARQLSETEIRSDTTSGLYRDMLKTLSQKKSGVALAAPQVGKSIALFVVKIQPTEHRPDVEPYEGVFINPSLVTCTGRRSQRWEGCISGGGANAGLFAKVPRYNTVRVRYVNAKGMTREETFTGLLAQIMQHEIDHLEGVLFVDRVKDTTTYMTHDEYLKHRKQENA